MKRIAYQYQIAHYDQNQFVLVDETSKDDGTTFVDMDMPCITFEQLSEYNLFEINDIQYCLHSILMGFWLFQLYKTHLQSILLRNSLFLK